MKAIVVCHPGNGAPPLEVEEKKTETRMFAVSNMKVINQEKGNGEEIGDRMLELVQIIVPTAKE